MKDNIILENSCEFAVRIIHLYGYMCKTKKEYVLSKQVLRSDTSIGSNVEEALGGVSKADFKHKLGIAYKEARETHYWLRLLNRTKYLDEKVYTSIEKDVPKF
jgi:four helix bundle protein